MRSDLNLLTKEEIDELELFIKSKVKNTNKDIDNFLRDLKSGKLKNKKIEVDALDFVSDGLTEIVDLWIKGKEEKQPDKLEKCGKVEKLVCAPNTRVGRFLNKYNKKQITLDKGIKELKEAGRLSEVLKIIADTKTRKQSFHLGAHDLNHTIRVLLNGSMIINMRDELSEKERAIIYKAIELHDTGRIHDFEDKIHGERAVQNLTNELDEFTEGEQELIKFIIIQHCKSTAENENAINSLDKSSQEKEKYRKFLNYMKDADKLDRVRFPELSPIHTDSLDPERLHFDESKQLIKFACEALENFEVLFSLTNSKSKEDLFSRKKVFGEYESREELVESVDKFLKENGYPERSKGLKLQNIKAINQKFVKDGYLYLLRGSRKGQKSGFFTYQYAYDKQSVEQYLRKNPRITADFLASQQSMRGRERFISATTDITVAAEFTKLNKKKNISGSIYVIKVKPENAFRVKSPIALETFSDSGLTGDESEYLIPDFVKPEEILEEFNYNDYLGIYNYLKNVIGLKISRKDIHLSDNIEDQFELSDEGLSILCAGAERNSSYWENFKEADIGFQILSQLVNNGEGKTTLEKILNGVGLPYDDGISK